MSEHVYEVKIYNPITEQWIKRWHSTLVINMEHGPNAWSFEIYFPGNPTEIEMERKVRFYRDSQLYFEGMIKSYKPEYTKTGKMMVARGIDIVSDNANDGLEELIGEYTDEPKDLMQLACVAAGINYGTMDTFGTDIVFTKDWPKSIDTFSRICGMIGWQSRVNPINNSLDFQAQVGQDRTLSIHFEEGETCTVMSVEKSSVRLFNRIYGKGKGSLVLDVSGHPYVEDVASQTTYGIKPHVLVERDITDHDTLKLRCEAFLDRSEDISITYKIVVKEPWAGDLFNHYNIADLVRFTAPSVDVDTYVEKRIVKMKITHDTNHGEVITMELGDKSLSFFQLHEKYKGYVETLITTEPVDPETVLNLEETAENTAALHSESDKLAFNTTSKLHNETDQEATPTDSKPVTVDMKTNHYAYNETSDEGWGQPDTVSVTCYGAGESSLQCYAWSTPGPGSFLLCEATFTNYQDYEGYFRIGCETCQSGDLTTYLSIHSKIDHSDANFLTISHVIAGAHGGHKIVMSCSGGNMQYLRLRLTTYGAHKHTHNQHDHLLQSHNHSTQDHFHTQPAHGHAKQVHYHQVPQHGHAKQNHNHPQTAHNHIQEEHDHVV